MACFPQLLPFIGIARPGKRSGWIIGTNFGKMLQWEMLTEFLVRIVAEIDQSLIPVPSSFLRTFWIAAFRRKFRPKFRAKFRQFVLSIFFDFWRGRLRRAKNRKKCQVLRPSQPPIPPSQPPIPPEFSESLSPRGTSNWLQFQQGVNIILPNDGGIWRKCWWNFDC